MKKLDIKLQVEGLGSDLIYEGRGGPGWSEKRRDQSPFLKGLVRYKMTQGIVGRIIKFDTELLRKGYVRVEGGGCIQVTKVRPHLRHLLSAIVITCNKWP